MELFGGLAHDTIDHAAALDGGACRDLGGPALEIFVGFDLQECPGVVELALRHRTVPGPDCDVGDGIIVAAEIARLGKTAVENVELALGFHRKPVDRVFDLGGRVGIEVSEPATEIGSGSHLPEQPIEAFGAGGTARGQKSAEFLGEVDEDRTRLEDADRRGAAPVEKSGDLGVRIDGDEAASELAALVDPDQPGVVLGAVMAEFEEFLEHDRRLHAVRSRQGVELEGMPTDGELLVVRGAGARTIDAGETAAVIRVRGPDVGRRIVGLVAHGCAPMVRRSSKR